MSNSAEGERETIRVWRIWRTVHELLADRGYEISEEEKTFSLDEFKKRFVDSEGRVLREHMKTKARPTPEMVAKYTPRPTAKVPNPPSNCGQVLVSFCNESTVGVRQFRTFAQEVDKGDYHTGIFITIGSVSPVAVRAFGALTATGRIGEHFQEPELLVNITHHELVPKHVLLSAEEKAKLLERYRLKESQLPRIQQTDPVAKYLGLRRGQVVKIIRRSETAGRYASYRWVI